MSDPRIVSGARCVWWGSIEEVGMTTPEGFVAPPFSELRLAALRASAVSIPCCPHCGGVLFECASIEDWFEGVDKHERNGHPHYRKMIEWLRGKHFKTWPQATAAWEKHINEKMLEPVEKLELEMD